MPRKIAIGKQDFVQIREKNIFYVDKTFFIRDWWNAEDDVTLICRPRRFGKTLTLRMVEAFFSNFYPNRRDLFEGLSVWEDEAMREYQGIYPVISLTFSTVKENNYYGALERIRRIVQDEYDKWRRFLKNSVADENDKRRLERYCEQISDSELVDSIAMLSRILSYHFQKKVIILLDEYDTPLLEAYNYGYWDDMVEFQRCFFNASFKANFYLEPALQGLPMKICFRILIIHEL